MQPSETYFQEANQLSFKSVCKAAQDDVQKSRVPRQARFAKSQHSLHIGKAVASALAAKLSDYYVPPIGCTNTAIGRSPVLTRIDLQTLHVSYHKHFFKAFAQGWPIQFVSIGLTTRVQRKSGPIPPGLASRIGNVPSILPIGVLGHLVKLLHRSGQ